MKEIIETSKGRFVVLDESELDFKEKKGITYVYNNRYLIDWHNRINLSELTEEQASSIVQQSIHTKLYAYYVKDIEVNAFCYESAIESLHSLLESHNIEITDNTYIFKV